MVPEELIKLEEKTVLPKRSTNVTAHCFLQVAFADGYVIVYIFDAI